MPITHVHFMFDENRKHGACSNIAKAYYFSWTNNFPFYISDAHIRTFHLFIPIDYFANTMRILTTQISLMCVPRSIYFLYICILYCEKVNTVLWAGLYFPNFYIKPLSKHSTVWLYCLVEDRKKRKFRVGLKFSLN